MQETKIGIVEDEIIIADSIRAMLQGFQYTVPEPCADYEEAIAMLRKVQPDLVLLDINLANAELDGIAVARYIRDNFDMPFIFLTANSDAATIARAKTVNPNAFLVKPFVPEDLYATIEIAMHNFYSARNSTVKKEDQTYIFIKDGGYQHKIDLNDILFLESDHVYVSIYTPAKKYLVRASLQQYNEKLDNKLFARIHRCYIINLSKIDKMSASEVTIAGKVLPVSKKYRDALQHLM